MIRSTTYLIYFSPLSFVLLPKEHPYSIFGHACSDFEVPTSLVPCQLNPTLYNAIENRQHKSDPSTPLITVLQWLPMATK